MNSFARTDSTFFAAGAGIVSLACMFVIARGFVSPKDTVRIQALNIERPAIELPCTASPAGGAAVAAKATPATCLLSRVRLYPR
jgi:hypothetical protein